MYSRIIGVAVGAVIGLLVGLGTGIVGLLGFAGLAGWYVFALIGSAFGFIAVPDFKRAVRSLSKKLRKT